MTTVRAGVAGYTPPPGSFAVLNRHLPAAPRRDVYRRAANGVASGGTLVIPVHDATNPTVGAGGPPDPDVRFSPHDLNADHAGAGSVVEQADRAHRAVATAEVQRVAVDDLRRARPHAKR